ncbi:MAG TPA: ABC transporter substrate binding protein [Vicinamibacteria bacterium]|nr:ABC transporter substrate binding protein [Vicinamibacteria bacterium]
MSPGSRFLHAATLALVLGLPRAALPAEVALLLSSDVPAWRPAVEAVRSAATGHNVSVHDLRGSRAEAERVIAGLKGQAAVLVAMGPLAAEAARAVAADTPLVYCMVQDPASVSALEGPNVTGVAFSVPARNQLVAFRAVNPTARRIGVVFSSAGTGRQVEDARRAASALGIEIVARQVSSLQAVPQAVRELLAGSGAVDALWVPPDPLLLGDETRRFVMQAAVQAGKPIYASSAAMVKEGALVSNSPEVTSIGESAAGLVNRIARGEKPGRLAVVVPRTEVVINKRIAEQLRLAIPETALRAAQRVF